MPRRKYSNLRNWPKFHVNPATDITRLSLFPYFHAAYFKINTWIEEEGKGRRKKKDQRQDEGGNIASNSSLNEDSPEGEQLQRKNGKLRTTRFQTWKIRLRKRSGGKGCWKIGWGQFKSSVCACVRVQMTNNDKLWYIFIVVSKMEQFRVKRDVDVEICKNSIFFIDVAFFPLLFFAYKLFHDVFETFDWLFLF